jgi:trimethylamine--corrinoid protein Co-methyltransferase
MDAARIETMRPQLRVVPDHLITPILDEAKRILAEIGVEVRGAALRQRLLDHGLRIARTADEAERVLFPPEVVDRAIATAPKSFALYDRGANPRPAISSNTCAWLTASSTWAIWRPRFPPTTSNRRCRMPGGFTW